MSRRSPRLLGRASLVPQYHAPYKNPPRRPISPPIVPTIVSSPGSGTTPPTLPQLLADHTRFFILILSNVNIGSHATGQPPYHTSVYAIDRLNEEYRRVIPGYEKLLTNRFAFGVNDADEDSEDEFVDEDDPHIALFGQFLHEFSSCLYDLSQAFLGLQQHDRGIFHSTAYDVISPLLDLVAASSSKNATTTPQGADDANRRIHCIATVAGDNLQRDAFHFPPVDRAFGYFRFLRIPVPFDHDAIKQSSVAPVFVMNAIASVAPSKSTKTAESKSKPQAPIPKESLNEDQLEARQWHLKMQRTQKSY